MGHVLAPRAAFLPESDFWNSLAVKLVSCTPSKLIPNEFKTAAGTGFVIKVGSRLFLATAAHCIEDELSGGSKVEKFTGKPTATYLMAPGPNRQFIPLNDGRAVAYIAIGGERIDAVLIEIGPGIGRFVHTPGIEIETDLKFKLQTDVPVWTSQGIVQMTADRFLVALGHKAPNNDQEATKAALVAQCPGIPAYKPWAFGYQPAGLNGFSGGPVLAVVGEDRLMLVGLHTVDAQVFAKMTSFPDVVEMAVCNAVNIEFVLAAAANITLGRGLQTVSVAKL